MLHIEKGSPWTARLPFDIENWIELGLGIIVILLRLYARAKVVGIKKRQPDDYITVLVFFLWAVEVLMFKFVVRFGANTGLNDEQRASISVAEMRERVFGTQCLLAGWLLYVSLLWALKACMLFFYNRLTIGLPQQRFVKFAACFCFVTYLAAILTILLHCTPLEKLWQISPNPGRYCTQATANYIVVAVTNVSTDATLLLIPLPLLIRVRLPTRRKVAIGLLLSGGIFVMMAALLRCFISLESIESVNASNVWGVRETFAAVVAVNAPCIKPLFSTRASNEESARDPSRGKGGAGSHSLTVFGQATPGVSRKRSEAELIVEDSQSQIVSDIRGGLDRVVDEEAGRGMTGIQVTTVYEVKRDPRRGNTE
ncbi:uncharacterized protein BO80DRAFT_465716 [Aspergillus ibericus CBS 121593]|uniref:Rhodopsin domain-containing protein n=1 Tax=Aspergillus ibericus CBS 121593 TaxID=1448316 RepID=A0A395GX55_9EURO|nr:hypothetical protein BO80DRAFT_465716 [Aspergillus ibericus CBS 121593]RAL00003.1 hypothetical protein BO80DRAFT_465716 [Aspergillus ibericus CBS 121593]